MNTLHAEARAYYEKALQLGKKEGGSPAVLDTILEKEGIKASMGFSLGIQTINLDQIIGTKTSGRSSSFSRSFFPLLKADTDFGSKWISLCKSHLEEGIHDPIKVFNEDGEEVEVNRGKSYICLVRSSNSDKTTINP